MLLQRTDSFHQSSLKVMTDTHNLSGCFHLSCQSSFCSNKFVKWQTRDLYNTVVQHRLKACIGFSCNGVWNLIQRIAKSDLCSNLGDRITGSLTCKSRRTAYTGIYLDNAVFKALRMKRILNVTSASDSQLCDNIQGRSTKHLVFFVPKSLRRSNYNRVACVNAYWVNVLHVADCDAVSCAVAHYFILNLFPACNAALYKDLAYTGKTKTIFENLSQFVFVVGNTAAAAAKSVGRTENNRISDSLCKCNTVFHCCYYFGGCNRLTDLLHSILKFLTVLCLFDRFCSSTDQTYIMLLEKAFFFQLHCKVQAGLTSQCRKHTVRFFFQDQLLYHLYSQRLNVYAISNIFICHDGCRV